MFPLDQGDSLSSHVSQLIQLIRDSGAEYRLTAMGTIIETEQLDTALALVDRCNQLLEQRGCQRIYATIKLDIRQGPSGRLHEKIESIERKIGAVES
jgi:uncharacterized protein (TIGR00106 family)